MTNAKGSLKAVTPASERVNDIVKRLVEDRTMSLADYVESLRDGLTSKDAGVREKAINELVDVILHLDEAELTDLHRIFLLEFLLPRVEDSGHVANSLITGIHFLVAKIGTLSDSMVERVLNTLFADTGVQSYGQKDRMLLFQIFESLIQRFLEAVKLCGQQRIVVLFMQAANSERDPRCLLKVFQLFNIIVRNFSLGVLVEDMFELVAVYFPIDYEPSENDVGVLSAEMLSSGCESCLLAHQSFAPFCFQLIAEKLLEDPSDGSEEHLKQQIKICAFLIKACHAFLPLSSNGLRTQLDDLLTAFRLICLSPAQTETTLKMTRDILGIAIKELSSHLQQSSEDPTEDLLYMADNVIENCEPFVLQAEMGLSVKALTLLEFVANSSEDALGRIVPRVIYWLNTLLAGITIKNVENRKEIAEEILEQLPVWVMLGSELHIKDSASIDFKKLLEDIFKNLECLESICEPTKLLITKFGCCSSAIQNFLPTYQAVDSKDSSQKMIIQCLSDIFVNEIIQQQQLSSPIIKSANDLLSICSQSNYAYCKSFLAPLLADNKFEMSTTFCGLILSLIQSKESADWIIPILFENFAKTNNIENMSAVIDAFMQRISQSPEIFDTFMAQLRHFLTTEFNNESMDTTKIPQLANFIQDVGLHLNSKQHEDLTAWVLNLFTSNAVPQNFHDKGCRIVYLLFLQTKNVNDLKAFTTIFFNAINPLEKDDMLESIALSLFFAWINRSIATDESFSRFSENLTNLLSRPTRLRICEAKAYLLSDASKGINKVRELFDELVQDETSNAKSEGENHLISDLLNFHDRWADPVKCKYNCTLMWNQRILCQFVPLYVNYFKRIPADRHELRTSFIRLVEPLLKLAESVSSSAQPQLKLLLPIFVEALSLALGKLSEGSEDSGNLSLLLKSSLYVLEATAGDELSEENLIALVRLFLDILRRQSQEVDVALKALKCLEILPAKLPKEKYAPFYAIIVQEISRQSHSKKRLIRQSAANVRNAWLVAFSIIL
ncbi:dos2-interacting transcription regulator of RNA-Pol-II domain-containing protein [Ditylenchus destructor]|nr:dos2-interacting transcription regulator of RNA-Pol-II domain-containing protein [Ditylenchus destructor]